MEHTPSGENISPTDASKHLHGTLNLKFIRREFPDCYDRKTKKFAHPTETTIGLPQCAGS